MRLLRIGDAGAERPPVERDDVWLDVGSVTDDVDGLGRQQTWGRA